jgi:hypothetical protein
MSLPVMVERAGRSPPAEVFSYIFMLSNALVWQLAVASLVDKAEIGGGRWRPVTDSPFSW